MIEGLFVVLEGVDGAGTTTHTKLLAESLRKLGLPILTTREPSDGPVGVMLRQFLTGRLVVPGAYGSRGPSADLMALLFAADRLDHLDATVAPNLRDGVTVLSDRYYHSSIAYQSIASGRGETAIGWIRTLNEKARVPDLTIVLDVPEAVSMARVKERPNKRELYEETELQSQLSHFYLSIETHFPNERVVHINSNRPIDEVAADISRAVSNLRNGSR